MCNLYTKIQDLCASNKINITEMCRNSGASRGSLTDLKVGRKSSLSADTLNKIANYFDVSIDYLLGNEKKPTVQDSEIKDEFIAFYGEVKKDLDENDIADLKTFMRMKAEIKRKSEKK